LVHRGAVRRDPGRAAAQRDHLPAALPGLAVLVPGRPGDGGGRHLHPGEDEEQLMRALIYPAPDHATIIHTARVGPGPRAVRLRSGVVGVCHSDLELLAGRYTIRISSPITPGHEWAGEVAEVGPGVDGSEPGDPVVGECVVGPGGRDHFGFSISGAAAE